jgi:hypothetical protein
MDLFQFFLRNTLGNSLKQVKTLCLSYQDNLILQVFEPTTFALFKSLGSGDVSITKTVYEYLERKQLCLNNMILVEPVELGHVSSCASKVSFSVEFSAAPVENLKKLKGDFFKAILYNTIIRDGLISMVYWNGHFILLNFRVGENRFVRIDRKTLEVSFEEPERVIDVGLWEYAVIKECGNLPIIHNIFKGIRRTFESNLGLSLELFELGSLVVGPSGCGKTFLLESIKSKIRESL